jgi:hypothetical protein
MEKTRGRPILNYRNYILPDGRECIPYAKSHGTYRIVKVIAGKPNHGFGLVPIENLCVSEATLRQAKLVPKGEELFVFPKS